MTHPDHHKPIILGWREWAALPGLEIKRIKAKLDTGAKTSTLHAFCVEPYRHKGAAWVRFGVHPLQRNKKVERLCHAEIQDQRWITDSGGHKDKRFVITTPLQIGTLVFPIELTLTNRDNLQFRLLVGRTALSKHFVIDPSRSYVIGKPVRKEKR